MAQLLLIVTTVEPLADEVEKHTCYDSVEDDGNIQSEHLQSSYQIGKVTKIYYTHRFLYAQEKPSRTIYLARLIFLEKFIKSVDIVALL